MPIQPYQIAPAPVNQEAQASDPVPPSGQGTTYFKEVSGIVELFFTNDAGDVVQLTSDGAAIGGGGGSTGLEKSMMNSSGSTIAINKPVSMATDGSIVLADSDSVDGQRPIGVTLAAINNSSAGMVALFGRNIAGALTGLGFAPGDDIFIDEAAGGFVNTSSGFSGGNDSVIRIGIAAMADGATGVAATDLIMMREVLIRP